MHADIDKDIIPDGSEVRQVLNAIMTEAQEELMYRRQLQRTRGSGHRGARRARGVVVR